MRDHRSIDGAPSIAETKDITEQVLAHRTKHPGSVRRSKKANARAAGKRAAASRKANR